MLLSYKSQLLRERDRSRLARIKILRVGGARPQFLKLALVAQAITGAGYKHVIVHTGQHYDPLLSDVFLRDLGTPTLDAHLRGGTGSHGEQTGALLVQMDEVLERFVLDHVLVYGGTV